MQTKFIEWSEENIDDKIARYLQRHLMSKKVNPSDVLSVQVVVRGKHGDTDFQFGASVSVKLCDGNIVEFEVSACELTKANSLQQHHTEALMGYVKRDFLLLLLFSLLFPNPNKIEILQISNQFIFLPKFDIFYTPHVKNSA